MTRSTRQDHVNLENSNACRDESYAIPSFLTWTRIDLIGMQLEEVSDEYDLQNDDNYTDDSGSDSEEDTELDSDDLLDETLYERITALKDIIPPPRRAQISYAYNKSKNAVSTAAGYGGKTLWAVTSRCSCLEYLS